MHHILTVLSTLGNRLHCIFVTLFAFSICTVIVVSATDDGRPCMEYSASTKHLEHIAELEAAYSGSDYNINWEEVKLGKAAGMPGGWKINQVSTVK